MQRGLGDDDMKATRDVGSCGTQTRKGQKMCCKLDLQPVFSLDGSRDRFN